MTTIKTELLDELLSGVKTPDDLLGDGGVFRQLKKALMERALGAELTHHLGYEKGAAPTGRARANNRNGHSAKTVLTGDGEIKLSIPRDRADPLRDLLWCRRILQRMQQFAAVRATEAGTGIPTGLRLICAVIAYGNVVQHAGRATGIQGRI
jgi:hypothetical protein